jgi:hypothetical protein
MTKEQTEESLLIVNFLELESYILRSSDRSINMYRTGPYGNVPLGHLRFFENWNLLMLVVDKIYKIDRYDLVIRKNHCYINDTETTEMVAGAIEDTTLEAVYKAVLQFIKWYNDQKLQRIN